MSDTIAAIATGSQVSAIGIVRMSGPDCIAITDRLFQPFGKKRFCESEDRKLVYGNLRDRAGDLLDICLCTLSHGPSSYTGEDTVEIQCHGSPVVLRAVLEELFALGARQAGPGEFTKRAFLNHRMELTAAEAVVDIIDAETVESAKNAAGQLGGAIAGRISGIYSELLDMSSHYHAVLDYPDEDIEDFLLENYRASLAGAAGSLQTLLDSFQHGKIMNSGILTAIVGRPNAGKSSLLNRLLGYDRAIVTNIPGTTRDTVEEKMMLGRLCLRLTDTAGIRETDDAIEALGVQRSRSAMERSDLVLAVLDTREGTAAEDAALLKELEASRKKAICIISKSDLVQGAVQLPETSLPRVVISSVTGSGIDLLEEEVNKLFPTPEVPAGEILTNARQADAVRRALESICAAQDAVVNGMTPDIVLTEVEGAIAALGELTGQSIREDITNRIFSRFCVGK
ncbi:MAG: tRNA uridine-5-carboxymethylaminomethyl(34) synthesis GTPase MnmE [Oscillospiraceae bacterium]|nr:tRNA uridine-5-carboxymethylaminomethyl(34) synthesis GTPase MnmE [Oscillospiraceae bacterium]